MELYEQIGKECLAHIKEQNWFPYHTGHLRDDAVFGFSNIYGDTYCIKFSGEIAPYIQFLEEGTSPHDIPNAFGIEGFGIGGRFDGKFHPGSTKHKGFISEKSVNAIIGYICSHYKGELK